MGHPSPLATSISYHRAPFPRTGASGLSVRARSGTRNLASACRAFDDLATNWMTTGKEPDRREGREQSTYRRVERRHGPGPFGLVSRADHLPAAAEVEHARVQRGRCRGDEQHGPPVCDAGERSRTAAPRHGPSRRPTALQLAGRTIYFFTHDDVVNCESYVIATIARALDTAPTRRDGLDTA